MGILKKTYLFLLAFFIGYPTLYMIQFWRTKTIVDQKDESNIAKISQMLAHSSDQKSDDLFLNMFDTYRQTKSISFYVIRDGTGRLIYPSNKNALVQEANYKKDSIFQVRRNLRIQGQDYIVFFGKDDVPFEALLWELLKEQREVLFTLGIGIILLIHQVASYFLQFDVNMIIQWFKGRSRTGDAEVLSKEAHRLKTYIHGVEEKRQQAEQMVQEYKTNSYSGLTWAHEQIQSGAKSVEIVAARCDINNYTVLKQKISAELLQYIVQTFFNRGGEYLSRYGAYKENAAGDEISFFVPKSENRDAELMAVHIVRGLFEIFQDLKNEFNLPGVSLTVKAALDSGTVELEKLGGNSETEGQPLINTARFLTTIHDKSASTLTVQSEAMSKYERHVISEHEDMVKVKNYDTPFALTYIHDIYGYGTGAENKPDIKYFRTDRDLALILQEMTKSVLGNQAYIFHMLRNHIMSIPINRLSYQVISQYKTLLKTGIEVKHAQLLSGIALLAKTLFTKESIDEEVIEDLALCLNSPDKRVVSNAREALHKLRPEMIDLRHYVKSNDNRIAADAMIDLVKIEGLTDEHSAQIVRWLTSKDSAFQLSALYVAYQVYNYWTSARPEYISLNHNFKALDSAIRTMDHTNLNLQKWLALYEGVQAHRRAG